MSKPKIIVLSLDDDKEFKWFSDGWYMIDQVCTERAQTLMAKARRAIEEGKNVPDVIKKLEEAGFDIQRGN